MKTKIKTIVGVAVIVLATILIQGCSTFKAAATTDLTVETALAGYDIAAKAGKTTVAQNQKVKAAYVKYQASMALLCDIGASYASGGQTNLTTSAEMQQATVAASQALSDVLTIVQTFTPTK